MKFVTLRECTHRERQRVRTRVRATNYPSAKLMEIAESVHTGRTHARVVAPCVYTPLGTAFDERYHNVTPRLPCCSA